jgi:hypothetical protein
LNVQNSLNDDERRKLSKFTHLSIHSEKEDNSFGLGIFPRGIFVVESFVGG